MTKELGIFILTADADNNNNWLIYNKYENKLEFVGTISIIVDESDEDLHKRASTEYRLVVEKFLYEVFRLCDEKRSNQD